MSVKQFLFKWWAIYSNTWQVCCLVSRCIYKMEVGISRPWPTDIAFESCMGAINKMPGVTYWEPRSCHDGLPPSRHPMMNLWILNNFPKLGNLNYGPIPNGHLHLYIHFWSLEEIIRLAGSLWIMQIVISSVNIEVEMKKKPYWRILFSFFLLSTHILDTSSKCVNYWKYINDSILSTQSNLIVTCFYLVFILNYEPCHTPLKDRCMHKINVRLRSTYLKWPWDWIERNVCGWHSHIHIMENTK